MPLSYQLFNQEKDQTLIMLHGAGFDRSMWHGLVKQLPEFRLVCVDLPGHGQSTDQPFESIDASVRLLSGLIEQLSHNNKVTIHICGISLGGYIALRTAFLFPHLCHSAYISGVHVHKMKNTWPIALMTSLMSPLASTQLVRKKSQRAMGIKDDSEFANWSKPAVCDAATLRKVTKAVLNFSMPDDELRQLTTRLMVTAGSKEHPAILKSLETIKLCSVNGRSMIVEGAGHAWPAENTDYFLRTLKDWVNWHPNQ